MWVPARLLLLLPALLPPASTADPDQPCPSEINKVKDLLEVNCTEQGLSKVPSGLPKETGILLLSTNRFTSLALSDLVPLAQLRDLDLSHNELAALHTGPLLQTLQELILSHNELQELPTLQGLPSLTHLALAHNRLAALPPGAFRAVSRLQDLDLRGNQLRTLPPRAFEGLGALKDLDLSDNLLEELPQELLQELRALVTLWLSGNRLRSLPDGFFPEGHIFMYVFLTENPWHCDCSLRYLRLWIRHNEDSVYQPERGLEKTKVEVAPEKVLCHSPAEHRHKPILHFRPDCGAEGDADEEEEEDYYDGEVPVKKAAAATSPSSRPSPQESTAVTPPLLPATTPPVSTPLSATLAPSTLLAMLTSTRAPSPTTPVPPSPTPSTAAIPSTAPTSTPHRLTTLTSTTPLTTTMSTTHPSTSSCPHTTLATSTTTTFTTPTVSTGTFVTTPMAVPSTAMPETSSTVRAPPPPLTSATPLLSSTLLPTHTPPAPLGTTHFTHPAPSPAPVPLCPCSTQGPAVLLMRSQAGAGGPQWGQWVLRHCCLLHWGLYLAALVLLVLIMLALAGCLAWMCLVGRSSWHKSWQTQEAQYPLLNWRESAGSPEVHPSSSESHIQLHTFCTIKEVELCPEVTYCTIKDLGFQRPPPAPSSFRTTKELWVHHGPPEASFKSFSKKLMVTNLSSLRTPSAYSLDRGVKAMGAVRVKYSGNTL
ncbi:platelet glycoprotein Ib alpha chain [Dryobates pubescens]|uniref:platelet glycoprotein Ib alpha chain n=1 Tax=Dryobates pubescens TaxID=118200 RepID=UPI0023B9EA94|nr:platelet glycoprotein Ib alpha chain [Dryobates pubescens]